MIKLELYEAFVTYEKFIKMIVTNKRFRFRITLIHNLKIEHLVKWQINY